MLASVQLVCAAAVALLLIAVAIAGMVLSIRTSDTHKRGALVQAQRVRRWVSPSRGRPGTPGWRNAAGRGLAAGRRIVPSRRVAGPRLRLGGIAFTEEDETRHFKLIGTTGTGKSTAIAQLLRGALARGDRAVIADPNGAYLERFFDRYRGDVLLNPFEPRSVRWDPFSEAHHAFDYDELARGLIPDCDDASGREWRGYARTLVTAVSRRCAETGRRDIGELWRLLAVCESEEMRRIVAGTPAQPFLDADNARMFGSIRSVAVSALAALRHIEAQRGRPFSVRDWVAGGRGVLFIPYRATQIAALRTIISTWMRLAIFEVLGGGKSPDAESPGAAERCGIEGTAEPRRLWFIVDELDALGAIDGLNDALARLRKFGGRCVLGFQSIAQISRTYGAGEAQTIVENCGNTLILRCSASERGGTSAFASRLIGEREVVRRQISRGRDGGDPFSRRRGRRSLQISHQRVTEAAVLPSEIEQLPDLTGYLKAASSPRWSLIRLAPEALPWRSTISA